MRMHRDRWCDSSCLEECCLTMRALCCRIRPQYCLTDRRGCVQRVKIRKAKQWEMKASLSMYSMSSASLLVSSTNPWRQMCPASLRLRKRLHSWTPTHIHSTASRHTKRYLHYTTSSSIHWLTRRDICISVKSQSAEGLVVRTYVKYRQIFSYEEL